MRENVASILSKLMFVLLKSASMTGGLEFA